MVKWSPPQNLIISKEWVEQEEEIEIFLLTNCNAEQYQYLLFQNDFELVFGEVPNPFSTDEVQIQIRSILKIS